MGSRRPARSDLLLAGVVLVAAEVELVLADIHPLAVAMACSLVASVALAFRRVASVTVVALCIGSTAIATWAGVPVDRPTVPILWIFISVYSVAAYRTLGPALLGLGIGLGEFASTLLTYSEDSLFGMIIIGFPWLVGRAMRIRLGEAAQLAGQVADLEESRAEEVRRAAEAERARIARELHDVIAHSVSVMVVQAGAASQVIDRDPTRASQALERIQEAGRDALTEMGVLVGLLREDTQDPNGLPHPGLGQLGDLLAQSSESGVTTTLSITGEPRTLPPGLQLSLYRVVQEALTNVRKHSQATCAAVTIEFGYDDLVVRIRNDGPPRPGGTGGQRGVLGMRERMAAYGGTVTAEPASPDGFLVTARVPLEPV